MNRREFLFTAGGTAGAVSAAAGPVAAQEGTTTASGGGTTTTAGGGGGGGNASNGGGAGGGGGAAQGPIDWGGYLDDCPYWSGPSDTVDARGQSEVRITVGAEANSNLSYAPAAVHVDPGTTIIWEWTGRGGGHNVESEPDSPVSFNSDITQEEGFTFEKTMESSGIVPYFCNPHKGQGMIAAVAVGEVPRQAAPSGQPTRTEPDPEHMGVPIQAHFVGIATILAICMTLAFTFFLLKYGESAHTKGGD